MKKKLFACLLAMMVACLSAFALAEGYDDVFAGDPLVFTEKQINRVINANYLDMIDFIPLSLYLVNAEANSAGEMTVTMRVGNNIASDQSDYHIRVDAEIGSGGLQRVVDHERVTLLGTGSMDKGIAAADISFAFPNPSLEDTVLHVRVVCPESLMNDIEYIVPLHFITASTEEKDVHLEVIEPGGVVRPDQVIAEENNFSLAVYWIEWAESGSLEVCADIKHNFGTDPDIYYADLSINGELLTKDFSTRETDHFGFILSPDEFTDGKAPEKIESISFRPIVYSDELENNPFVCDRITYYLDVGGTETHLPAWTGENIEFEEPIVVLDYEGYKLSFTGIILEEYDDNKALIVQGKAERPFDDEICVSIDYVADGKRDNENCYGDDFFLEFDDADALPSEITLSLAVRKLVEWVNEEEYDEEEFEELESTLDAGLHMISSYTPEGVTSVIVESDPLLKAGAIKLYFDK